MNKILSMTKDIEKSFKSQNRLTVVAVAGSLLFALVVGVYALTFAEKQREKIYVLDQGKSLLLALQTDAILSKDVEIRDHVTRFHELMFTLSPQKQTIQENLDRAFNLADRSAYEYSQDLAEKGYCGLGEVRLDGIPLSGAHLREAVCGAREHRQPVFVCEYLPAD